MHGGWRTALLGAIALCASPQDRSGTCSTVKRRPLSGKDRAMLRVLPILENFELLRYLDLFDSDRSEHDRPMSR